MILNYVIGSIHYYHNIFSVSLCVRVTVITSRIRGAMNLPLLRSRSLHGVPFTVVVIPWILRDVVKSITCVHGITTTVNGTPCNDIEWSNGRFVAPRKRDIIAVSSSLMCTVFARSDAMASIYFAHQFCAASIWEWQLFKSGIYFAQPIPSLT